MKKTLSTVSAAVVLALGSLYAQADDASALGNSLTPMGAEKSGNADGSIPVWDGGITTPLAGHVTGGHYADPYADEKPKFIITAKNADQYKEHLMPGQLAMLKKYPDWKLRVFPTHRSASFPQKHYDETKANVGKVKLAEDGNSFSGTTGGIPFPLPKTGLEVIWNHLTRYRGETYELGWSQAAVTREGDYTPVRFEFKYDFYYGSLKKPAEARKNGKLFDFLQEVTSPARLAGQIILVHEFTDSRKAWTYNPGQRRVRLAPNIAYDNPGTAADGLRTNDDFLMFNGAPDRYDWKLVGKREIYIPYNSYKLVGNTVSSKDVLQAGHINPDLARYELHRVWVVDSTLKPGTSHIYKRRTFFVDEDSWMIVGVDAYDARDQLWRFSEQHAINYYDVPMYFPSLEVHHDLQSGSYIAMGLRNDEDTIFKMVPSDPAAFTPAGLRRSGKR